MKSSWTIEKLYRQSFAIVKKHKVLWLFGMFSAAVGPLSNSFRSSSNLDEKHLQGFMNFLNGNKFSSNQALGASTNNVFEIFQHIFSSVPAWIYAILVVECLLLIAVGIFITIVKQNWATAALLYGIYYAAEGKDISIKKSSNNALPFIKDLFFLSFIPSFLLTLIMIAGFTLLGIASTIIQGGFKAVPIILLIAFGIIVAYAWIMLMLSLIWASREIIFTKKPWRKALSLGYAMTKKRVWAMLGLGIVNMIASGFVVIVPIGIFIGILVGGFFAASANKGLSIGLFGIGGILGLIFILGFGILGGILTSFKATVWTLAYKTIRRDYDEK